jgi:hypothetical protein
MNDRRSRRFSRVDADREAVVTPTFTIPLAWPQSVCRTPDTTFGSMEPSR